MIVDLLPNVRPPIPSRFKNFALMKAEVDVGPMLEEIDSQPATLGRRHPPADQHPGTT